MHPSQMAEVLSPYSHPQPVVADSCPSLSILMLKVTSCFVVGVFCLLS